MLKNASVLRVIGVLEVDDVGFVVDPGAFESLDFFSCGIREEIIQGGRGVEEDTFAGRDLVGIDGSSFRLEFPTDAEER